ncbi:hypothetical protein CYMTET_43083 [Cymbomonas tetramitiformis]|uniref:PTM/DIR17-like Tudor domain-containing protein n=1 Tax=Cymbomonas tetramitiformis TaxID=36881 RepID=A0AAE0C4I0_9CHLO|nr:hypothetical protein CYMTET_43083 [Cymbomonas tetramitiformis]
MLVEFVTGWGRDSCKVNGSATGRLQVIFPGSEDLLCICHTLNNSGEHSFFPEKRDFMTSWLLLVTDNSAAGTLWKELTGTTLVSFSNTRWWSKQEVANSIAINFGLLPRFLEQLSARGIGDATTKKMIALHRNDPLKLQVGFAAGLDGLMLMLSTTYELEGDRLEILLAFRRIEALRAYGRQLVSDSENRGLLPNVDALIRRSLEPAVGLVIKKEFAGHGVFVGKIISIDKEDAGKWWYLIEYEDGDQETMDLEELRPHLSVHGHTLRDEAIQGLSFAFTYLAHVRIEHCYWLDK